MEKAIKWNFKTKEYEPYEVPDEAALWGCSIDDDEVITCAECGKKILYRDACISRNIDTVNRIGYIVCKQCYDKECDERKISQKY